MLSEFVHTKSPEDGAFFACFFDKSLNLIFDKKVLNFQPFKPNFFIDSKLVEQYSIDLKKYGENYTKNTLEFGSNSGFLKDVFRGNLPFDFGLFEDFQVKFAAENDVNFSNIFQSSADQIDKNSNFGEIYEFYDEIFTDFSKNDEKNGIKNENYKNFELKIVQNLMDFAEILADFEVICVEDLIIKDWLISIFPCIYADFTKFSDSLEGALWTEIFRFQKPYDSRIFDGLERFLQQKLNSENVFPFLQFSNLENDRNFGRLCELLENDKLCPLFQKLFGFTPIWEPNSVKNVADRIFLQNSSVCGIFASNFSCIDQFKIGQNGGDCEFKTKMNHKNYHKFLLSPSLVKFSKKKVAYIFTNIEKLDFLGQNSQNNENLYLFYDPKFQTYKSWEYFSENEQNSTLNTVSTRDRDLYFSGKLSKLRAKNRKIFNSQKNLYSYVKNCAIDEIKNVIVAKSGLLKDSNGQEDRDNVNHIGGQCDKKNNDLKASNAHKKQQKWKEYLANSGLEYIVILRKAESFIDNFRQFFEKYNFCDFEFDIIFDDIFCDFYGKYRDENGHLRGVCVFFSWSHIVYKNSQKIRHLVELAKDHKSVKEENTAIFGENKQNILQKDGDFSLKIQKKLEILSEIKIITCDEIVNVDFDAKFSDQPHEKATEIEDDLFYWNLF